MQRSGNREVNAETYEFEYSQEFKDSIIEFLRDRDEEGLPFYKDAVRAQLGGPLSRLSLFGRFLYPEIRRHCGKIRSKTILDFGCGTGAMTAVLAMHCQRVVGFDVDQRAIDICRRRLEEHKLLESVRLVCAPDFLEAVTEAGSFDIVLLNAVLEHLPLSKTGLRRSLVRALYDVLKVGGYLYVNGTPNRLWPIDLHTTKLWWIPWTKPGSRWAYSRAVRKGRTPPSSEGPLDLEERGAWGGTFFEIMGYLSGNDFQVINSLPRHTRHINYSYQPLYRRLFEFLVYHLVTRWTKIPITAFAFGIDNLAIRKLGPVRPGRKSWDDMA